MTDVFGRTCLLLAAATLATVVSAVPTQADLNDGVVGYWSFDEGEGEIAHDYSGNGNDATLHGAVWDVGISGYALSTDGVDDYAQVPDDPTLDLGTGDFAVAMWVCRLRTGLREDFLNKKDLWRGPPSRHDIGLFVRADDKLRLFLRDIRADEIISSRTIGTGWTHVAATRSAGRVTLFLNGVEEGTGISWKDVSSDGPLRIAANRRDPSGDDGAPVYCFAGFIDELRIYNRALSAAEIRQLMWCANPQPTNDYLNGDRSAVTGTSCDPINTATGNFFHQVTDLSAPTRGGLMAFTRYYNSAAAALRMGRGIQGPGCRATEGTRLAEPGAGPSPEEAERPRQRNFNNAGLRRVGLAAALAGVPVLGLACWLLLPRTHGPTRRAASSSGNGRVKNVTPEPRTRGRSRRPRRGLEAPTEQLLKGRHS